MPAPEAIVADETMVYRIRQQTSQHRLRLPWTLIALWQSIG
jgi:hypothetical protein